MKKRTHTSLLAVSFFLGISILIGCGIYTKISVSSDNSVNYSNYKTFAWLHDNADTNNSPYNNSIIRNNLKNYFGKSFAERGYKVNLDTPDVLLQIVIVNKNRNQEIIYQPEPYLYYDCSYYYCSIYYSPNEFDYYYRNSSPYCYGNGACKRTIEYVEGSITLNVIDRKLNKLIWSGTAKGDIYDPEYIHNDIHPAVLRIMKKYPVKEIKDKENKPNNDDIYALKNVTTKK
jgi:Domain of unknown function (DUF4136)